MTCVLVADDEPSIRRLMADALTSAGYEVLTAANGAQALQVLHVRHPDAIVLDMTMPVLDGPGFVETYRKVVDADIPIVAVSAAMTSDMARELRVRDVRYCLSKPFELGELLDCVERLTAPGSGGALAGGPAGFDRVAAVDLVG